MFAPMRRLLATSTLALLALCAIASPALARTAKPTVTSFSPAQVPVGGTLVIKGKNFRSGAKNNRVFLSNATTGKTVRARPDRATKTRIEVKIPATITKFMDGAPDAAKATTFQIAIFTTVLGSKTRKSRSPLILPAGAAPAPGTPGGVNVTPPPAPDCDADGTPDSTDTDDDNDGLGDDVEAKIHTDPCKADTDGDGIGDAFEYYSSLDLNANPNYAGKRPFPNPLDATDAQIDFDGDGLTQADEYAASLLVGQAKSAPLAYSDGNQTSAAAPNPGAMDLDGTGRITDEEKDVDNDGLPNWIELVKGEDDPTGTCSYVDSSNGSGYGVYGNMLTDCGLGPMPNGRTFGKLDSGKTITGGPAPFFSQINILNWLDNDSDGDGTVDGQDDQDFDGLSNLEEIQLGVDGLYSAPKDPCDPNPDARSCPTHASHNP